MKKSLFLYLFILSSLINVFTYKYFTSKEESQIKAESNSSTSKKSKDQQVNIGKNKDDNTNFSLLTNPRAQHYLSTENNIKDFPVFFEKVKQALINSKKVQKEIVEINKKKLPGATKFSIVNVRLLNHSWLIADYTSGGKFGEVLLSYVINGDNSISFEIIKIIVYPVIGT